jgi:hypothetical protein
MAGFGEDTIFKMLASQFLSPGEVPQAPGINRTAMPDFSRPQQEPIDLGAGAPSGPRPNFLSSLGGVAQQLAPMIGGMMSSPQAANAAAATRVAQAPRIGGTQAAFGLTQPRQSFGG